MAKRRYGPKPLKTVLTRTKRGLPRLKQVYLPKEAFDRRSFRTVTPAPGVYLTIGCPAGKYDPARGRCRVGTRIQRKVTKLAGRKRVAANSNYPSTRTVAEVMASAKRDLELGKWLQKATKESDERRRRTIVKELRAHEKKYGTTPESQEALRRIRRKRAAANQIPPAVQARMDAVWARIDRLEALYGMRDGSHTAAVHAALRVGDVAKLKRLNKQYAEVDGLRSMLDRHSAESVWVEKFPGRRKRAKANYPLMLVTNPKRKRKRKAKAPPKALAMFRKWHGQNPTAKTKIPVPSSFPSTLVSLGRLEGFTYQLPNGQKKKFVPRGTQPVVATNAGGTKAFLLGADFSALPRGARMTRINYRIPGPPKSKRERLGSRRWQHPFAVKPAIKVAEGVGIALTTPVKKEGFTG